jgi:hypothetical protein
MWWYTPIIPALGRLKKDHAFKAGLGYTARPCLKITTIIIMQEIKWKTCFKRFE